MITHQSPHRTRGFTLVELLVAMTVIAILAGLLSVAVGSALNRAREFAIQNEMMQLEAALEKFNTDNGFYPPSFKGFAAAGNAEASANRVLSYLSRISPNHVEGVGTFPMRPVDIWWNEVGQYINQNPGSDLVFWLSGLARNRQRPLTRFDTASNSIVANAAHPFVPGDTLDRQEYFSFEESRVNVVNSANGGAVAQYSQSDRKVLPYRYLDAANYFPTDPTSTDPTNPQAIDGAYVNPGVTHMVVEMAAQAAAVNDLTLFKQIYPNPDSFQLISVGLDEVAFGFEGAMAEIEIPNDYTKVGPRGADNLVNFGSEGIGKLETLILDQN